MTHNLANYFSDLFTFLCGEIKHYQLTLPHHLANDVDKVCRCEKLSIKALTVVYQVWGRSFVSITYRLRHRLGLHKGILFLPLPD